MGGSIPVDNDTLKWTLNSSTLHVGYEISATDYAGNVVIDDSGFVEIRKQIIVDIIDPVIAQVSLNMPSKNIPIAKAGDTVELTFKYQMVMTDLFHRGFNSMVCMTIRIPLSD